MAQEHKLVTSLVKGCFHQGNTSLFSLNSAGKQCVPNCAIAALYTSIIPLYRWTSNILDNILISGDKLYNSIDSNHDFLQVNELGEEIVLHNNKYTFQIADEYFGQIDKHSQYTTFGVTLDKAASDALEKNTHKQWTYCILCVGNQNGASASLLCLSPKKCNIFDPHSRNSHGLPIPNGTSVLMLFENRCKMISYIRMLY